MKTRPSLKQIVYFSGLLISTMFSSLSIITSLKCKGVDITKANQVKSMKNSKFKFTQILQRSMFAEIMQIVLTHVVSPLPPDCLRLFNGGNNERGQLSYLPFHFNHAAANSQTPQTKPLSVLVFFPFAPSHGSSNSKSNQVSTSK